MIRDLDLKPGQLAAAQVSAPTAGEPDQPTIEFKVRLNRHQATAATVSVAAAAELVAALQAALAEAPLH
ncbi:hypothetical protein ACBJ59_36445 [Nonomuraea sp. MTCD27]|uniref:hypothetical protein n=1 Tax=Nonomuraea sp. MTCD27 TaxID=1676747 RepID=UPI0035C11B2F